MSVEVMALVFKFEIPALQTDDGKNVPDSTSKFVLLALADHASGDGENAYIGVRRIISKTQLSASTVCNALNALRHNGYITLVGKSKSDTNNYTINVARFQSVESGDSSQWNQSVPATRTKPLINQKIKPLKDGASAKPPTPEEVKIFRAVTSRYPNKENFESVVKIIQSVSARLGRSATVEDLLPFYQAWTFRGFKPTNMNWTSWAVTGIIPDYKPKANNTEPKAFDGVRQYLEGLNVNSN